MWGAFLIGARPHMAVLDGHDYQTHADFKDVELAHIFRLDWLQLRAAKKSIQPAAATLY